MILRSGLVAWRRWSGQALEERDRKRDSREAWLLLIVAIFIFSNALAYSLVRDGAVLPAHLYAPLVWLGVIVIAHFSLRALRPNRDPFLLPIFALLAGWGLLLQDRLAVNFLGRQTLWFVLATAAMLLVAILPRTLRPLLRYRYSLLLGGLLLLAVTLGFGVNPSGSGAALWLPLPFPFLGTVYFQPSELLKLLLVIFLASYFTEQEPIYRYRKQLDRAATEIPGEKRSFLTRSFLARHMPFLGPLLLMWGFTLLLLVWQQDLGAAALFFIVFVALVYLATGDPAYVWSGLALLLLAGVIAFFAFDTVIASRVTSWINPWPHSSDRAYQIVQSLYAQAAGGMLGQGIGQGYPDYIPVVHSDFALAAIAEEWGLLGTLTIVACFAILAQRGLRVALLAIRNVRPNFFHAYLAAGLVTLFSVQAFLIMGGVTRILPLTGITLPFVSYGGSSLLVSSLAIGLILFLSADVEPAALIPPRDRGLARRISRLGTVILSLFAIVAVGLSYWGIVRSEVLLAREDNPRLVETERRIRRGRILDRNEAVLAETSGPVGALGRVYPMTESGPAVGYHSLRFGAAGIENAFNSELSGQANDFWPEAARRLLHQPAVGDDVRLTLDAGLQADATMLMTEEGATGGLVLLEITETGGEPVAEIRAMASLPSYDPNLIDDQFETLAADDPGALFNRAAQGLYQPGLVLQPFITAAAVDGGLLQLNDEVTDPFLPVTLHGQVQRCTAPRLEGDTTPYTWQDMTALGCPGPLQALGMRLGATVLDDAFVRFGFTFPPILPIPTEGRPAAITDPGLAAIGQEALTVTPLQVALATAALAGQGLRPAPRLVDAVAEPGGEWAFQPAGQPAESVPATSQETAQALLQGWPADEGVSGYSVSVLSGPDGSRNVWFVGMAPAGNPRFILALVLEGEEDPAVGERIGRQLLAATFP